MSRSTGRNADRLNYLFTIIRMIDRLPLTRIEREALPQAPRSVNSTLRAVEVDEAFEREGMPLLQNLLDDPNEREVMRDEIEPFDSVKLNVISRSQLDEEKEEPETRNQKIIRSISENQDKVQKIKNLLNISKGRQFTNEEVHRIIFLTLEGTDDKLDDLIKDLSG